MKVSEVVFFGGRGSGKSLSFISELIMKRINKEIAYEKYSKKRYRRRLKRRWNIMLIYMLEMILT